MAISVAERVEHKLPRPVKCDHCGSPKVSLEKRGLMGYRTYGSWDLVWHCGECGAMVGCHEGTDIPYGTMADHQTRAARVEAHKAFDPLWKKMAKARDAAPWGARFVDRELAYRWMAEILCIPYERAHVGMFNMAQCEALIAACRLRTDAARAMKDSKKPNWRNQQRKRRR